jgi:hypothetical protein
LVFVNVDGFWFNADSMNININNSPLRLYDEEGVRRESSERSRKG